MRAAVSATAVAGALVFAGQAVAQAPPASVVDPKLEVRTVVSGLTQPVQLEFLKDHDFLVLEKSTGQVKRIKNGAAPEVVLDLPVNFASERGLLGIALDQGFKLNGFVYLFWSESTTGADSGALDTVPLLGNRLDRFIWNGSTLTYDKTLHRQRAYQADEGQPLRANHNGGVLRVGPDGKIYLIAGDRGRRGQLQNLFDGPFGEGIPDDQFGGPDPVNDHLTGVILRLNPDGTAPRDNPFYKVGAERGGQVGANLKKVYAYGIRNSFGMAFDPFSGDLWEQENGDDSFSEINRAEPGFNSGWVQVMGPLERVAEFKAIETTRVPNPPDPNAPGGYYGLQQIRWDPINIADTPWEAFQRLYKLPGSEFSDPEMAWKYEVAPGGIDFLSTKELGKEYKGDLFVGSARGSLRGGNLFRLKISDNRKKVEVDDKRLKDRVADNLGKYEITESESLLFGENFGVTPDVRESPDGTLYVVSNTQGTVYEIRRK
ncbi:MAG TPA: PQQ-dependent sugar dehydrogenase [Solirubrobacter sp.]